MLRCVESLLITNMTQQMWIDLILVNCSNALPLKTEADDFVRAINVARQPEPTSQEA